MITPGGMYGAEQQGLFGTTPSGPSFHDYVYSNSNTGFGINAQYLTPNYTAAYRPAYGGPTGEPNPYQTPTSIGTSAWYASQGLPLPGVGFGMQTPYYQNALGVSDYHSHNLVAVGPDASANILQQYVAPIAATYYGAKLSQYSPFMASGMKAGIQGMFGQGLSESWSYRAGSMAGKGMGGIFGGAVGGASKGLIGRGSIAGTAGAFSRVAGVAGGIAGTIAAPIIIGQGLYNAADAMMFDPYVQTRRGAEGLKANLFNQALGSEAGAVTGGFGISSTKAYEISSAVNRSAFTDFGFKDADYTSMMDYSAQAGLFDSMRGSDFNSQAMSKKIKEIAGSVKDVMHVFGEKDMQEAIGILSKFSKMGFGPGTDTLASSLMAIKSTAAYSGKSAGEIFHSAYLPAAYAYQGQGMNALLGGKAGVDAYRGFEAALKNGLVDKSVLATLGGSEGATQLYTNASLRMAGTQYNMMAAYNEAFLGKPVGGGIVGNINAFAQGMGADPLRAAGNIALYGNQMLSNQMSNNEFAMYTQAADLLRMIKPGDKNAADYAAVLTQSFGLSDEEARATVLRIQSGLKVDSSQLAGQMINDTVSQRIESEGMSFVNPTLLTGVRNLYTSAKRAASTPGDAIAKSIGSVSDGLAYFMHSQQFPGRKEAMKGGNADALALKFQGAGKVTTYDMDYRVRSNAEDGAVVAYINKYATSMDARMRDLASGTIKNGLVDVKAFKALQKATGDTSVSASAVMDASRGEARFRGRTTDYGNADAASLQKTVEDLKKKNGLEDLDLLIGYEKAEKEGPLALEEFIQNNEKRFKDAALKDSDKSAIKYSGAFAKGGWAWAEGELLEKLAYDYAGKGGTDENRKKIIREAQLGSDTYRDLTKGVTTRLYEKAARTQEGQGVYAYMAKGLTAARSVLSATGLQVSDTRDRDQNKLILDGTAEAAAASSATLSLNQAMKGIDFQTGINLNDAVSSNNPFEKAGAMLLKGANIIAATAEEEARRKGKSFMNPTPPSPVGSTGVGSFLGNSIVNAFNRPGE